MGSRRMVPLLFAASSVACGTSSNAAGDGGATVRVMVPLPAPGQQLDSTYGDLVVSNSDCFAIGRATGSDHPELETFAHDGRRLGRWDRVGNGPKELRAIDGLAQFADTFVVWDLANARLTYLDCGANPIRSHTLGIVGLTLAALGSDTVFLGFDPMSPSYGRWAIGGRPGDTVGPRIVPRLRGARDMFAASPDGSLGVLDVSAGVLLRFRPGMLAPFAADTLPDGIQLPLRAGMRELRASSDAIREMPLTALAPLWIQFLGADTLAIGYPPYQASEGVAIAKWKIGQPSFARVMLPTDSVAALGSYSTGGVVFLDSTLLSVGGDSVYRYRISAGP